MSKTMTYDFHLSESQRHARVVLNAQPGDLTVAEIDRHTQAAVGHMAAAAELMKAAGRE